MRNEKCSNAMNNSCDINEKECSCQDNIPAETAIAEKFMNDFFGGQNGQQQNNGFYPSYQPGSQEHACVPMPPMKPKRENCCCKKSMKEALQVLCNTELGQLIDFKKFAFISDSFTVGAKLVLLDLGNGPKDNLSDLSGMFKRFSPCDCDLIEIEGAAYYNFPQIVSITELAEHLKRFINTILGIIREDPLFGTLVKILEEILKLIDLEGFTEAILKAIYDFLINYFTTIPTVDKASLCGISAIAFESKYVSTGIGDCSGDELTRQNFEKAKHLISCQLEHSCPTECGKCKADCDCDDCCCVDSILQELFSSNLTQNVTLTAGSLAIQEATVLGVKGDVLVLANEEKQRFYLVCANAVEFIQ